MAVAVDTRDKRACLAGALPLPDGNINDGDRSNLLGLYRGVAADSYINDTFTGATADLENHVPDVGSTGWTKWAGVSTLEITGGVVSRKAGWSDTAMYELDSETTHTDYYTEVTINMSGNDTSGPLVRHNGAASEHYLLQIRQSDGVLRLYRRSSGYTTLDNSTMSLPDASYVLRLQAETRGEIVRLRAFIDGAQVVWDTSGLTYYDDTDASRLETRGVGGLYVHTNGSSTFDDFTVAPVKQQQGFKAFDILDATLATAIASHQPTQGDSWAAMGNYTGTFAVDGNGMHCTGSVADAIYLDVDPGCDDYAVQAAIKWDGPGKSGLMLRMDNVGTAASDKNCYLLWYSTGTLYVRRQVSGGFTSLDQMSTTFVDGETNTLRFEAITNGSQIDLRAWIDGAIVTWDSSGTTISDTNAARITDRGRGGIYNHNPASNDDHIQSLFVSHAHSPGLAVFSEGFTPYDFIGRSTLTGASRKFFGGYSGDDIDHIQVRLIDHDTETVHVDWTTVDAAPANGYWEGTLTHLIGGWNFAQVRARDSANVVLASWDDGFTMGCGVVVGLIGQSNGSRYWNGSGTVSSPTDRVRWYPNGTTPQLLTGSARAGQAFVEQIITNLDCPVAVIDGATGSTALRSEADTGAGYWLDTTPGEVYGLWKADHETIDADLTGQDARNMSMEAILWIQGENDASSGVVTEAEYNTSLQSFITDQLRTDFTNGHPAASALPIVVVPLGRKNTGVDDDVQAIRSAQKAVAAAMTEVTMSADTTSLALDDTVHYAAGAENVKLGQWTGEAISQALDATTNSLGPVILSYERTGTAVTLHLRHVGGTDFTPTSALEGFEAFDDATPITITAAVRTDATTITLTLNSAPTGVFSCRYSYGADAGVPDTSAPAELASMPVDDSTLLFPLEGNSDISLFSLSEGYFNPLAIRIGLSL